MKYQSELINEILEKRGHEKSSLHYQSECIETWIEESKGSYPKLCDYESEWLIYINENPIGEFPYETITDVTEATVNNVVPYAYKSAILKGQTLVNLAIEKDVEFTGANQWKHLRLNQSLLNSSKKYLLSFDSSQDYNGYVHLRDVPTNTYVTSTCNSSFKQGNNKFLIKDFLQTELNTFADIRVTFHLNNGSVVTPTISNAILLEYIEGMENWDIPYFEGMQSVKMPVLTTTGKNLFDKTIKPIYVGENGVVTYPNGNYGFEWQVVKPNTSYVLSYNVDNNSYKRNEISYYTKDKVYIKTEAKPLGLFTTPNNAHYIVTRLTITNEPSNIQLEEGTVATSYEPFKSNILTVNEDVTLRGIGDVQDTLDCLTGELTERIGEIVLDGSEAWTYGHGNSNETIALFYANLDHNVEYKPSINDKLPSIEGYSVNFGEGIYVDSDINIRIKRNKLNGSTVDNFKQWLSNNPITLQYKLNQSNIKTVDLTVVNQDGEILNKIKPIEGTMHISTDGTPLKPSISMEVPVEAITQNLASFIKEE